MTIRLLTLCVVVATATSCNVTQPSAGCPVGHGNFAAKYTLISGTGACADLKGNTLSVAKYLQPSGPPDSDGFAAPADFNSGKVYLNAINPTDGAGDPLPDPGAPSDLTPAVGDLAAAEPEDGSCRVPTLTASASTSPVTTYEWSDLRIFQAPGIWGTQMSASLRHTAPGCEATYTMAAMYPRVACGSDADPAVPDNAKCTDPKSGVDPKFAVTCDPVLLYCVLTAPPLAVQ